MKIETESKKENMMITMVMWVTFALVSMSVMLYVASGKTIVIADAAHDETGVIGQEEAVHNAGEISLILQPGIYGEDCIRIPLAKGTKAENVVMENRYMARELWIYLKSAERTFYEKNAICGDLTSVLGGCCEIGQDGVVLKLAMSRVLEFRSTMENDTLVIACYEPQELYEQIVVVDPLGGGREDDRVTESGAGRDIPLQVAKQLQKRPEQENIKIYYTGLEDADVSVEERLAFAEAVKADIYIVLGVCRDTEQPECYGIQSFYNEDFFIPEFGNVQLADILTRNVTVAAGNRAIGLSPADADSILGKIEIPAAEVCVGYLSNAQEQALLQQEFYQQKLAEGLANAILEVYTSKNTSDEVGEL